MRQVLRAGALGWHKPLQYCKVISLQLIKINEKKKAEAPPRKCRHAPEGPTTTQQVPGNRFLATWWLIHTGVLSPWATAPHEATRVVT